MTNRTSLESSSNTHQESIAAAWQDEIELPPGARQFQEMVDRSARAIRLRGANLHLQKIADHSARMTQLRSTKQMAVASIMTNRMMQMRTRINAGSRKTIQAKPAVVQRFILADLFSRAARWAGFEDTAEVISRWLGWGLEGALAYYVGWPMATAMLAADAAGSVGWTYLASSRRKADSEPESVKEKPNYALSIISLPGSSLAGVGHTGLAFERGGVIVKVYSVGPNEYGTHENDKDNNMELWKSLLTGPGSAGEDYDDIDAGKRTKRQVFPVEQKQFEKALSIANGDATQDDKIEKSIYKLETEIARLEQEIKELEEKPDKIAKKKIDKNRLLVTAARKKISEEKQKKIKYNIVGIDVIRPGMSCASYVTQVLKKAGVVTGSTITRNLVTAPKELALYGTSTFLNKVGPKGAEVRVPLKPTRHPKAKGSDNDKKAVLQQTINILEKAVSSTGESQLNRALTTARADLAKLE